MSGWSNGWIRTAPVSDSNHRALIRQSSMLVPSCSTSAPYPRVAISLGMGAPSGMNTVALMPSSLAASATPWAGFLLIAEAGHARVGAADLERPGALQVLALEVDISPHPVGQGLAELQRGRADDTAEQPLRSEDIVGGDGQRRCCHLWMLPSRDRLRAQDLLGHPDRHLDALTFGVCQEPCRKQQVLRVDGRAGLPGHLPTTAHVAGHSSQHGVLHGYWAVS